MHKTVCELEQMPFSEFLEWCAFFRIEEKDRNKPTGKPVIKRR